jgi:hypothetical protein
MAKKKRGNMLGSWAFLIGVILAVIFGFIQTGGLSSNVTYILVVLGLIVGLLNITDEEASPFLIAGAVLVIVAALGSSVITAVPIFDRILEAMIVLFVPATIIVALKHVFTLARR